MIFTLEALQAEKGDSLILHFGPKNKPSFLVIDGGPNPVYQDTLRPRLDQLREKFANANGRLEIEMAMVSHIDDDHINGILSWFRSLRELEDTGETLTESIQTLWFNSFDDVLGNGSDELRSRLSAKASKAAEGGASAAEFNADPIQGRHSAAIIASVRQGRELRAITTTLAIPLNKPFEGLVMPGDENRDVALPNGLKLRVLGPTLQQAAALQEEWEKDVRNKPDLAAAFADRSVANLSSIVAMAEFESEGKPRRILLTGDARGDFVWDGMIQAGYLTDRNDNIHIDVLKMPHHGSNRNMRKDFLQHITADHYVISANGENDNPDAEIFGWIAEARGSDDYTIHMTNKELMNPVKKTAEDRDISAKVMAALDASAAAAPNRKVVFRAKDELSLKIDLGTSVVDY